MKAIKFLKLARKICNDANCNYGCPFAKAGYTYDKKNTYIDCLFGNELPETLSDKRIKQILKRVKKWRKRNE